MNGLIVMKRWFIVPLLLLLCCSAFAQQPCSAKFSVIFKDDLNNIRQGLKPDDAAWLQKKLAKKYPDVCYESPTSYPPLVFYIWTTPATYNGYRTATSTEQVPTHGTVTDSDGNTSIVNGTTTSTSTYSIPESVDYDRLTLSVETRTGEHQYKVLHSFAGKTIHPTMYGVCTHNCHPFHALIETAMKWIHNGGMNDPMQTVLTPEEPK